MLLCVLLCVCSKYLVRAGYLQFYNEVISDLKPDRILLYTSMHCTMYMLLCVLLCVCSKYLVRASYLQIYNEVISDLLKPDRTNLAIREDRRR